MNSIKVKDQYQLSKWVAIVKTDRIVVSKSGTGLKRITYPRISIINGDISCRK